MPFNAPSLRSVEHDRRLVRRYFVQSALRWSVLVFLLSAALGLLPFSLGAAPGWGWFALLFVASSTFGTAMGSIGMAGNYLRELRDQNVALTAEHFAAGVAREVASPFDRFATFDLCADALSGLALGSALGYGGPAEFAHDPFKGRIVLGRWRPLWLWRSVVVELSPGSDTGCAVQVRSRAGLARFAVQKGEALRAADVVCAQLRRQFERRRTALEAARRERELERASLQARLSALQAQVEPHFLFNTLANLKYLIRTDQQAAQDMLDHLVGYLQNALPDMRSVSSTLGRELDLVSDYLAVMRIRMGERLRWAIEADDRLRSQPFPPAMLISLVENAVKHGLERASRPGTITVAARADAGSLRVSVLDDGVGLTEQAGEGTGLANIAERLMLLYGQRASLAVGPNGPRGVQAVLTVPLAGGER